MNDNEKKCRMLTKNQTVKLLSINDNFIILTHASPDGDTLGSAYALYYALKECGKKAQVICPDEIPCKYNYFITATDNVNAETAMIIAVDIADEKLLGCLKHEFAGKIDICIDHHVSNTKFAKNLFLDYKSPATGQTVFEIIKSMKVKVSDIMAKAIYTAISTDTGSFKYSNVTEKTHLIAAQLYKYNIDAATINKLMFDTKSKRVLELERMVLDTAEFHFEDRCMLLTVTEEMQQKTGCYGTELESIAVISRSVEGVLAGVTIKQTEESKYNISLRTYPPLDASMICKNLGGGGHKAAAGATAKGTLEEVKQKVLESVKSVMEEAYAGSSSYK